MRYVMTGGLATEELGGELLLCDVTGTAVHRLSGEAQRYFGWVSDGPAELPDDEVTAALVAAGVITPLETGVSRRRAIAMGAAAAAAVGVMTVGLPTAAMAASPNNPDSWPVAPESGTAPSVGSFSDVFVNTVSTTRITAFIWYNDPPDLSVGVTYNWRLFTPASSDTPYRQGTSTGQTPNISVPNGAGQTYLWLVKAAGGEFRSQGSTFP